MSTKSIYSFVFLLFPGLAWFQPEIFNLLIACLLMLLFGYFTKGIRKSHT